MIQKTQPLADLVTTAIAAVQRKHRRQTEERAKLVSLVDTARKAMKKGSADEAMGAIEAMNGGEGKIK